MPRKTKTTTKKTTKRTAKKPAKKSPKRQTRKSSSNNDFWSKVIRGFKKVLESPFK